MIENGVNSKSNQSTIEIEHMDVNLMVTFTYYPADPESNVGEEYKILTVYAGVTEISHLINEEDIIDRLQEIRKEEEVAYGSGFRGKYKERI